MAAAVFLHNAIFAAEPPSPPPAIAGPHHHHRHHRRRSPNRRLPHDRQLSSVSSITLHASASEHSHPTESLMHPSESADAESTAYLDLLARQPTYPDSVGHHARASALSLRGDPFSLRERRVAHEKLVRRRLKRLRLAQRVLWVVIGGWATYNTVRYYISAVLRPNRERQIIALVLGSCTALCLACNLLSVVITVSAAHLGWYYRPRSRLILLKCFLHYCSSISLLAPAFVNVVLTFLWRHSPDIDNSIRGRCHWEIDLVWSGYGGQCQDSPAWGFWLTGSLVRLILTAGVLATYHAVSYQYMVTRRPSRRRHTSSIFRHSAASFPSHSTATTASSRSFRPLSTTSVSTVPVSSPLAAGSHTSLPRNSSGNADDAGPRTLRTASSRIMAGDLASSGASKVIRRPSAKGLRNTAAQQDAAMRAASPSSSEGADTDEDGEDRYGRPVQRRVGGYAAVPLGSPPPRDDGSSWDPVPDSDLNDFATQFRSLVEEVTRATNDATAHPDSDRYSFPGSYNEGRDRDRSDAHVVVGRTIHRMPTIESLGSHEVMSLASKGGFSTRNSTRSNTLSTADAPTSRSASRANSLDAAVSLSVSVDGPTVLGMAGEMSELVQTPSSATSTGGPVFFGSRSTSASFHTARSASAHTDDPEEG
ncbi:hypothetical protein BD311DRAFT_689927 [Dichomitus squalens]|uniref:Uncharacterized protein n=1 Tax=Dichomitus squalens TaxID=114155 RepID=A0A4Q9MUF3_9APHY|nr:hypothetical protein BD311DRAFT_689927 [Dichomitus squalens]